jgi:hypothetical protein
MTHDNLWLEGILDWLRLCRTRRDEISWEEAIERIDPPWLRLNGFGPPTVAISALWSALVNENPRTSGPPSKPPKSTTAEPSIKNAAKQESAQKRTLRIIFQDIGRRLNGLTVERRNELIREEARTRGLPPPSDKTIQRYIKTLI